MITTNKLFDNLFADASIIPARLLLFGREVRDGLIEKNDSGQYDDAIKSVSTVVDALEDEVSNVDTGINTQKVSTQSVNNFTNGFIQYMSDNESVIAKALGGWESEGYLSFYPNKMSEYSRANKGTMTMLTTRVGKAAVTYAEALGTDMSTTLQGFGPAYTKVTDGQSKKKVAVKNVRDSRGTAFVDAQWVLTDVVHTVALANKRNPEACAALFPFSVLYPQANPKRYKLSGKLGIEQTDNLLNRTLKESNTIRVYNKSTNASLIVGLRATADGVPPVTFEIAPGEYRDIKATELGDLKYTFFMIKNVSTVNIASYEVVFTGFKKPIEGATDVSNEE